MQHYSHVLVVLKFIVGLILAIKAACVGHELSMPFTPSIMLAQHQSRLFSMLDVVLLQVLLDAFTIPTLIRLRSTCRLCDAVVSEHLKRRYNVLLLQFLNDTKTFRSLLTEVGGLISGPAGAALASNLFQPRILDVFVPIKHFASLLEHLLTIEKYTVLWTPHDNERPSRPGISQVIRLERNGARIYITESAKKSAAYPVVTFWTTSCMELFNGNGVVMPYPLLSEETRGLRSALTEVDDVDCDHLNSLTREYEGYGFDIRSSELDWFREP